MKITAQEKKDTAKMNLKQKTDYFRKKSEVEVKEKQKKETEKNIARHEKASKSFKKFIKN